MNTAVKQERLLRNIGDLTAKIVLSNLGDVLSIDQDLAAVNVRETEKDPSKSALTRARVTDKAHFLSSLNRYVQTVEECIIGTVMGKDDVLKFNTTIMNMRCFRI